MIELNNLAHAQAIATASGTQLNKEFDVCISRSKDGELLGGSIYTDYTGRSIVMHVAGFADGWISKDLLWVSFHYPFVQLKCDVILGWMPVHNSKALEFDKKLGFKEEAIIRDVYPEGDMVLLSMRRDDCRWWKVKPHTIAKTEYSNG